MHLKVGDKVIFTDTDGENKEVEVFGVDVVNWEGRPSVEIHTHDGRKLVRPISKLQKVR